MNETDTTLRRIVQWAEREEPIRAVLLMGSRARETTPDALADYDIAVYASTFVSYLADDILGGTFLLQHFNRCAWTNVALKEIGPTLLSKSYFV